MVTRRAKRTITETEQIVFVVTSFLAFALMSQLQNIFIISLNQTINLLSFGVLGGLGAGVVTYKYRLLYKKYRYIFFAVLGFMIGYGLDITYDFILVTSNIAGLISAGIFLFFVEEISKRN